MIKNIQVFFGKYKILLALGFIALVLLIIFLDTLLSPPKQEYISPPLLFKNQADILSNFPSYLQTEINKTTEKEVEQLPNRKEKTIRDDGSSQYSFFSADAGRNNVVVTKNNIAVFKSAITVVPQSWEHPQASVYINQYGEPEAEFTGSVAYGQFAKTYLYASKGFALIFNPFNDEVFEIQSFVPVSVEEYMGLWGEDIKNFSKEEIPQDAQEPL